MRSVPEWRYSTRGVTQLVCWDLRNPGVVLQRIQFAVPSGSNAVVSGTERFIGVWRPSTTMRQEELCPLSRFNLSNDHGNDVSAHKSLPISATSSGQRLRDDELNNRNPRRWVRVSSGQ